MTINESWARTRDRAAPGANRRGARRRGAGSTASLLVCTRRTILTLRQRVFLVRFDARRTLREVQCDLLCAETQSANQPFWLGRGMAAEPSWRFFCARQA
jgi:hypothetical protein